MGGGISPLKERGGDRKRERKRKKKERKRKQMDRGDLKCYDMKQTLLVGTFTP